MNNKQLKIIGLKAKDYRTLEAVELTPDIMSNSLIRIIGEHGAGKSSTIDLFKIPLTGLSGNNTKENVGNGFSAELLLFDGEKKVYLGVKVEPTKKGEAKGSPKETWYLYTKKENGDIDPVFLNNEKMTASSFTKEINTSLTFNIPSLFTKNATEHRKVIEGMFAEELSKLGANEVIKEINAAKEQRDSNRMLCGAVGAFMETFEAEGWNKESLDALERKDIEALQSELNALAVEKGGIIQTAATQTELNKTKAQGIRDSELAAIKGKADKVIGKIRDLSDQMLSEYHTNLATYSDKKAKIEAALFEYEAIISAINKASFLSGQGDKIKAEIEAEYRAYEKSIGEVGQAPIKPVTAIFDEDGKVVFPEGISPKFDGLREQKNEIAQTYLALKNAELVYKTVNPEDTSVIDVKITAKQKQIEAARLNNALFERYEKWLTWIESCGVYDSLVDKLRRLYAEVDTGVKGLSIYPEESARGVDIWLKYNGIEDKEFFRNQDLTPRFLWDYSGAQQGVLGIMLQGSMLNRKDVALRLAVVDEMPLTALGVKVMTSVTEKYNVQLITTYADTHYDLADIEQGVVVIENGEAFFKGREEFKGE